MKLHYLFFLTLILVLGKAKAQSPISLTSSNFPINGDTLRYSTASPSATINYSQTGTNYNWDFSNLIPVSQGLREYKSGLQTPYFLFFIGLTEYGEKIADTLGAGPLVFTNYYNFYKKQTSPSNAYIVDGAGITFSSLPIPSYYSDKDELYMFPMSYPQHDSTTFKFSTPSTSLIPIVYSKSGYRITKVDGWGNITTPYGTAPCLRIETTQYSQDSIKNTIIPIPIGFPNYQRSYQWLTSTSKIPYLEVTGNLVGNNFTITQIRYRDSYRTVASVRENEEENAFIKIYPNPVIKELEVDLRMEKVTKIEVFDMNGKLIKSESILASNNGKSILNVENLTRGLYLLKATGNGKPINFKFIKQQIRRTIKL